MRLVKGHGTENDFLVLPDLGGVIELDDATVRTLCERRRGIGADGILRVVRPEHESDWADPAADFAMDYRNADGSAGEMCGNGIRVFAAYLEREGLFKPDGTLVATRGGTRTVTSSRPGWFSADMGRPTVHDQALAVRVGDFAAPGVAVDMPNPHVVVLTPGDVLDQLDLTAAPAVTPPRPQGQNVEFVVPDGPHRIRLRVHERGVGETRSCGTGACAAVAALAGADRSGSWQVDVPGGQLTVAWTDAGHLTLAGPAVLVADVDWSG